MRTVSRRMTDLAQSEIRAMTQACVSAKGLNMAQGVCDTPVPPVVLEGAERAIRDGYNVYTRFDGLPDLRRAIAEKQERFIPPAPPC
jgi:aminotransferase